MYRVYAKVNEVYLGRLGSISPVHGFILLNEEDLFKSFNYTHSNQMKIYSEDGSTYYEVKDGELVKSIDPDIETNTLLGYEPVQNINKLDNPEPLQLAAPVEPPLALPAPEAEKVEPTSAPPSVDTENKEHTEHSENEHSTSEHTPPVITVTEPTMIVPAESEHVENNPPPVEHIEAPVGDKLALAEERAQQNN